MRCCQHPGSGSTKRNSQINKILREAAQKQAAEIKIIILGPSGSGKSTFRKGLELMHGELKTPAGRSSYAPIVRMSIVKALQQLAIAAREHVKVYKNRQFISQHLNRMDANIMGDHIPSAAFVAKSKALYSDAGIKRYFKSGKGKELETKLKYWLERINTVFTEDYKPTASDILYARLVTIGIVETKIYYAALKWNFVDTGGQKSERRKWLPLFNGVDSVIYVTNIGGFDETAEEQNSIELALAVFEKTVSHDSFANVPIMLFLNKLDILKLKMKECGGGAYIQKFFPEYSGSDALEDACRFFKDAFMSKLRSSRRPIYVQFSCLHTDQLEKIWQFTRSSILESVVCTQGIGNG